MRVAVLGAGIQGTLIALELADRGNPVDLYDRGTQAIGGASLYNEGKIHLGYVYAADGDMRSARLMVEGAMRFATLLGRWIPAEKFAAALARPDIYAVLRDTMVDPEVLFARYRAIARIGNDALALPGADYLLERPRLAVSKLDQAALERHFDPGEVVAAYQTGERSVDALAIAEALRDALASEPLVTCHWGHEIGAVRRRDDGRVEVLAEAPSAPLGAYPHVVNALWGDLHHVDRMAGVFPGRPVLQRRKFGVNIRSGAPPLPPTTFVLGPFGAVVSFPGGRSYLSWYPVCCTEASGDLRMPRHWLDEPDAATRTRIRDETVERLARIMPGVAAVAADAVETRVAGGPIVAWGRNDIDVPDSELHRRFDVGVRTHWGNYHSVDTAKYTLAPLFAEDVARRIAGEA